MNSSLTALVGLSAAIVVAAGSATLAAEPLKPDKEMAAEYKSEASQLREKAASHRKLAQLYNHRTLPKGAANFTSIAPHCENLAKYYEQAAQEAEAISSELAK